MNAKKRIMWVGFLAFAVCAGTTWAGTITVDVNDGGCVSGSGQPDPYAVVYCSIQDAITDAAPGDTINVAAGTYDEYLVVQKSVHLIGAGKSSTTLTYTGSPTVEQLVMLGWNTGGTLTGGATIQGFKLLADTGLDGDKDLIKLRANAASGAPIVMKDNLFQGDSVTRYLGIETSYDAGYVNIENNEFQDLWFGAWFNVLTDATIQGNTITNVTYSGVALDTSDVNKIRDIVITGNTIDGSGANGDPGYPSYRTGLRIGSTAYNLNVNNNTIANSADHNVYVADRGTTDLSNLHINDNNFENNPSGMSNETSVVIDAENNWWNDASGPSGVGPGSGDPVGLNIDYDPWRTTPVGAAPTEVWVDDDWNSQTDVDTYDPNLTWQYDAFSSIQDGVDAVSGSTVHVLPGLYEEQVHVTTNDLDILGSGSGSNPAVDSIIQSPASLTWFYMTSAANYPIVGIDGVTGVSIEGFRIDGLGRGNANYRFQGVGFWNSGGALTNCDIVNVIDTPFSGAQHGVGVYAYNNTDGPYTVDLTNVNVTNYQKGAMALNGTGLTANVTGCTTLGAGATSVTAQNGIQFYGGDGGTISDCSVTGNIYTGSGWAASGILLISAGSVDITNTTVVDGDPAVYCQDTNATVDGLTVSNVDPDSGNGFYVRDEVGVTLGGGSDGFVSTEELAQPFGDFGGKGGAGRGTLSVALTGSTIVGHCTSGYGVSASNYTPADTITVDVTNSTITDWQYGFVVFGSGGDVAVTASNNAIFGNGAGFYSALLGHVATNNWWGDASGPLDDGGTVPADNMNCADVADIINSGGLGDYVFDEVVEYCPWLERYPRVTLEANAECYEATDPVIVKIWMHDISELIRGGQYFLEYDNTVLGFVSAVPATTTFTVQVSENVNETEGTIDYATGINDLGGGSPVSGDAQMAVLTFTALTDVCSKCDVITWRAHDPPSRLTDDLGGAVYPALVAMDVIDDEAPTITCPPDVTVECSPDVPAADFAGGSVSDNCDPAPTWTFVGEISDAMTCPETITRTYQAQDHCGNISTCDQIITVDDTTAPAFTLQPADITIQCDDSTDPADTNGPATATDNCGMAPTDPITYSDVNALGGCNGTGTITRTWTAEDACGNTTDYVQVITVIDTEAPTITCPDDITVNADADNCTTVLNVGRTCFGDHTFNPTFDTFHFDDVLDLTQKDVTLTYTIDLSQVTQTAAYETPYVEVGLRQVGASDFNPGPFNTYQGGAGGWMTSLVEDLATDPNLLDTDDKHNLSASGGRGEMDYDSTDPNTVVGPYGTFSSHGVWFDRDGVDPWQAADPLNIDGATYNTGGVYDVVVEYHAISPTLGTMFATVNGVPTTFDTSVGGLGGEPAGLSFTGDMTAMQVFAGAWYTGGAGGPVVVSDICVTQSAHAMDNCDTDPDITAMRSDGLSLTDPYPAGTTTITWRATDDCGNFVECDQLVTVNAFNDLVVTVELSPSIDTGGALPHTLTRCITFELWDCDPLTGPIEVQKEVAFTVTAGSPNVALGTATLTDVPCGSVYECVTARDELHTLRRTGILGTTGSEPVQYTASFTGDVSSGGDWLIGGNLNDDFWIDILDFGVFSSQWSVDYDGNPADGSGGNTDCSTSYPHADINGDSEVDSADFTFIQINFWLGHEANCCGLLGGGGDGPLTEISVEDLRDLGLGHLSVGDLNEDGWLDMEDVSAFLQGVRPEPQLPVEEAAEVEVPPLTEAREGEPTPILHRVP